MHPAEDEAAAESHEPPEEEEEEVAEAAFAGDVTEAAEHGGILTVSIKSHTD